MLALGAVVLAARGDSVAHLEVVLHHALHRHLLFLGQRLAALLLGLGGAGKGEPEGGGERSGCERTIHRWSPEKDCQELHA